MRVLRFLAVIVIFGCVSAAWMILGGTVWVRTEMQDSSASKEIEGLWGPTELCQTAPYWARTPQAPCTDPGAAVPAASRITADIKHQHRYKGLLWFSTFAVDFAGEYTIPAAATSPGPSAAGAGGFFIFRLPDGITSHDALKVAVDQKPFEVPQDQRASGKLTVPLERRDEHVVAVAFTTYGQDVWLYAPGPGAHGGNDWNGDDRVVSGSHALSELKDFSLTITTDFEDIDYPKGTRSPKQRATAANGGRKAVWQHDSLVTRQPMGMVMPKRDHAGPIVARMSFFAPVSLFFFFTVLFTVVVLKKLPLHPMHYLFIAAGFFAFHILMAYLADIINNIHAAFWVCAAVSVFLVVSYMRLVAGVKFAVTYVAAAQLAYLVGFSYAFLLKGRTGLTVTIGAVLTLFVLMQATGRVKWQELFRRPQPPLPFPPPPAPDHLGQ